MAYPTTTEHYKVYPYTSIMASPYSCDPTGVLDCSAAIEQLKANQSNVGTIHIPRGTFKIGTNLTIPVGMRLTFEAGSLLSVATGITLTINGQIVSPDVQIFTLTGTGSVLFGSTYVFDFKAIWFPTLSAAIDSLGSTYYRTLNLTSGTYSITADKTVPSNVSLNVDNGVLITIATTKTLTINGSIVAGLYQIFSCTGTGQVVFGPSTVKEVYPEWWGAKGDGVTDDSIPIQAAIDCATASAVNQGPSVVKLLEKTYCCNITLKSNVHINSDAIHFRYPDVAPYFINIPILKAAATGAIIDTPAAAECNFASIKAIGLQGLGAATPVIGIHFRNGYRPIIENVGINDVADQAILMDTAHAPVMRDVIGLGLADVSRAAKTGVLELGANVVDGYFENVEMGTTLYFTGVKSDANLYCVGIKVAASTCTFVRCLGETADIGWEVSGHFNNFTDCRGEFNQAHGYDITIGNANRFSNCEAARNSLDATDTYNGFNLGTTAVFNRFVNCFAYSQATAETYPAAIRRHKYGFYDPSVSNPDARNLYVNCSSRLHVTGWFNSGAANPYYQASTPTIGQRGSIQPTDATATPDVEQVSLVYFNYTTSTTITNFLNGVNGQSIQVMSLGAGIITIANNATIYPSTLNNLILDLYKVYNFTYWNGVWWQNTGPTMTATRKSVAYDATVTPNFSNWDYYVIAQLTGDLAFANPTAAPAIGKTIFVDVNADGVNRVITWGALYKAHAATTVVTANKRAIIQFMYNGTNYCQVGTIQEVTP